MKAGESFDGEREAYGTNTSIGNKRRYTAVMSTGLNCHFVETSPGVWYYLLEDGSAPKQAWDWREFSTAYGPFDDLLKAQTHLQEEHANPGGSSIRHYEPGTKPDEVLAARIKEAIHPEQADYDLRYR